MRLGRIASPDGVAFVSIEGPPDDPTQAVVREIAEHPFGTPTFTGRALAAGRRAAACAHLGQQGGVHREELRGPRRRDGRGRLPGPGDVHEAQHRDRRPECAHCVAVRRQPGALRGRTRPSSSADPARTFPPPAPRRTSWGTRSVTTCRRATSRRKTASGPAPRVTTRSVRSDRGSSPISIPPTWSFAPRSTGKPNSTAGRR